MSGAEDIDAPPVFRLDGIAAAVAVEDVSTDWTRGTYAISTSGEIFTGPNNELRFGETEVHGKGDNDAIFGQLHGLGVTRKAIEAQTAQGGLAALAMAPEGILAAGEQTDVLTEDPENLALPADNEGDQSVDTENMTPASEPQVGRRRFSGAGDKLRDKTADRLTKGRATRKKPAEVRPVSEAEAGDRLAIAPNRKRPKMTRRQHAIGSLLVLGLTIGSNEVYGSVTGQPMIDVTRPSAPFHGPASDLRRVDNSFAIRFIKKEIKGHIG